MFGLTGAFGGCVLLIVKNFDVVCLILLGCFVVLRLWNDLEIMVIYRKNIFWSFLGMFCELYLFLICGIGWFMRLRGKGSSLIIIGFGG